MKDRGAPQGWSRRRWVLTVGLPLVLIGLVAAFVVFGLPRAENGPATDIVRVTRDRQVRTVSLAGTIQPQRQATATFRVPGTVTSVAVKVGLAVKAGQRLATVGTRDLADAVTLARANLAAARAQLTTVLDTAKATKAQADAARAQVAAARASLNSALNRLEDATLTAPIAGTVAQVGYEVGDEVSGVGGLPAGGSAPGLTGLGGLGGTQAGSGGQIVIVSTGAWQLDASVGTVDLPDLKPGQRAAVTPTGTSLTVDGTVDTVGIVAEQASGATATFPVTVVINEASERLFSGSSADAIITVGEFPNVLTVLASALTQVEDRITVDAVRGDQVAVTAVVVGRRFGSRVEIVSGLREGDLVRVPRSVVITKPTPTTRFGPPASSPSATRGS